MPDRTAGGPEGRADDDDGEEEAGAGADGAGRAGEAGMGRPGSLRGALGMAPPVWVELLGAYGRTGDVDRAARMLARLEDVCVGRDDAALWIHRARVMFLALARWKASPLTTLQ